VVCGIDWHNRNMHTDLTMKKLLLLKIKVAKCNVVVVASNGSMVVASSSYVRWSYLFADAACISW
jgi:hypothetical protein